MNSEHHLLQNDLVIDEDAIGHLKEASVWGKFLGILGFVYSAVIALSGILAGLIFSGIWSSYSRRSARIMEGSVMALIYLLGATIIFFMSLYLFRFAKKIQVSLVFNNQEGLSDAFRNLKLYFRFAGIISIITLVLTVFAVVGLLLAAAFSRY
jgi:Family of unknown function (DUF5362)